MNKLLRIVVPCVIAVGLGACASTQPDTAQTSPAKSNGTAGAGASDVAYIAQVERSARRRGIEVKWVNPPGKRPATP